MFTRTFLLVILITCPLSTGLLQGVEPEQVKPFEALAEDVLALSLSDENNVAIIAVSKKLFLYNLKDFRLLQTIDHEFSHRFLAQLSPDGSRIALCRSNNASEVPLIRIVDLKKNATVVESNGGYPKSRPIQFVEDVRFTQDRKSLIAIVNTKNDSGENSLLTINIEKKTERSSLKLRGGESNRGYYNNYSFLTDEILLGSTFTGVEETNGVLFGKPIVEFPNDTSILQIASSSQNMAFYCLNYNSQKEFDDQVIKAVDYRTKKELFSVEFSHRVSSLSVSEDGSSLLVQRSERELACYSALNGKQKWLIKADCTDKILSYSYSSKNKLAAILLEHKNGKTDVQWWKCSD